MPRHSPVPLHALSVPTLALILAACGPDLGQAKLCERALYKLVDDPKSIEVVTREEVPGATASIRLIYKRAGSQQKAAEKSWIKCHFDGGRSASGRLELVGVETSALGKLRLIALAHLRRQMGYRRPPPEPTGK